MKKIITLSNAPKPIAPYSQAVFANGILYVSGQIAINPFNGKVVEGGVTEQTRQVMENIGNILKEAGMDYSNIVKCNIFMLNMDDFGRINTVYGEYFKTDPPAREAIQASGLPLKVMVEISCIATK